MKIRQTIEDREEKILSSFATFSRNSCQRLHEQESCPIRTVFQHDRDRILHSKAFRRLKHKTQVFLSPEGDHYRTRLTHTLEVAQIARTVARALALNEDLTEAIALGHDLGHTPFGHAGERVLHELLPGGFRHARQSLRVVDVLEKGGQGLNLTQAVRVGILHHSKGDGPLALSSAAPISLSREARIVRIADVIAYVNHDLDDALRGGVVTLRTVPADLLKVLGKRHSMRINRMVRDLVEVSLADPTCTIGLSPVMEQAILELRDWLYASVYRAERVHDTFLRTSRILRELFAYFMENEQALIAHGGMRLENDSLAQSVADFIAGMSDRFALALYDQLFMPKPWRGF